ncbi:hypothetical protein [Marinoscillum furvescens]|uniref:Uncharacterized protein n=1 Tax=Marinoscillum furvescens DSM 4134 TaxID=1122208 RepID=A0A3D9KXK8_MARFU|nr:hypothetical protein [Marinoscillum furvescens]RED93648.1 hypothetical protein C7460_12458 [Marinoscillum furvescens DSM 4134]
MTKEEIQQEIDQLESQLTGNMMEDMEIRDKIHNLKMIRDGIKPGGQEIECVGCGS